LSSPPESDYRAPLPVLYEDNHLLVIDKPAGMVTMGARPATPTMLEWAKHYVKQKYDKPGNVYLGVVSRLDAPVTGVLLLARTSKAAARLSEQFRTRKVEKTYWAAVPAPVIVPRSELVDSLRHDDRHRRVHVTRAGDPDAREARLAYRALETNHRVTLVEVTPVTGRKHQIRVQLAHAGYPVVGDQKYGSREPFTPGIALHARRLVISHPVRGEPVEIIAPLPASWNRFGFEANC
jgi:23S rRNA pseudouridine1911/1915/1917 synthase